MKKIFLSVILSSLSFVAIAQMQYPVKWLFTSQKKERGVYEILCTATMQGRWHIYSQHTGDGPVPTSITFKKNPLVTLIGSVKEKGTPIKHFEKAFDSETQYYMQTVTFVQKVSVRNDVKTNLTGEVEFMVCDDTQCLAPKKVSFDLKF